jgi:hypothetical protein
VRPHDTPDTTTTANGFTDYFEPGTAGLYRLEVIEDEAVSFNGDCLGGDLCIEPAATLRLTNDDVRFLPDKVLYVEGALMASGTEFRHCGAEGLWAGLYARNRGQIALANQCTVLHSRIAAGPASRITLSGETQLQGACDTCSVMSTLSGTLHSTGSIVEIPPQGKYLSVYGGSVKLSGDSAHTSAFGSNSSWGINMSGGYVNMRSCRLLDVYYGISSRDFGLVTSGDMTHWGMNRIDAIATGLLSTSDASIEFGVDDYYAHHSQTGKWGKLNAVNVESLQYGYHAWTDNGTLSLYADSCYWSAGDPPAWVATPTTYGAVSTFDPLTADPVPFTSSKRLLSKAAASPPAASPDPPLRIRIMRALANGNRQQVRNVISSFLQRRWAMADVADLAVAARQLHFDGFKDLRDSLRSFLDARTDVQSKLLLADMAMEDSLYAAALEVLNSYSFAGSPALLARALVRKSIAYPLAEKGGYARGLAALDSLQDLSGNDPVYADFISLYPRLFSGLQHDAATQSRKKSIIAHDGPVLPEGVELWPNYPNPFRDVTSFTFKLGDATHVRLSVHDAMGREVAVLTNGEYNRGVHSVVLQSAHLPSGLYFYRFSTDEGIIHRKMMLVR